MQKFSLAVLIALISIAVLSGVAALKSPLLHVAFLDVGQGDAILITSPDGNRMLVDGGPDQSVLQALGRVMPFYDRSIDVVLATSEKSPDTAGLAFVFDRFNVGAFIDSGILPKTTTYRTLLDKAVSQNIPRVTAREGDDIDLGDGAHFIVLSSGAEITGKIIYGNTSISIPADIPAFATSSGDIVFESNGVDIVEK